MINRRQTQDTQIILIDEEEENAQPQQRSKEYPLPGIAQRIFKKQVLPSGQVKYLVKWQGYSEDDATWENEQIMREKHNELIQDYEFYVLTGERFDAPESKSRSHSKEPKRAIMTAGRHTDEERKRQTTEAFDDFNLPVKTSMQQFENDLTEMIKQQYKSMNNLKNQLSKPYQVSLIANTSDKIESVKLSTVNDDMSRLLFTVDYETRGNGEKPYSEYYSYLQLSQQCPYMSLKFLESELFGIPDPTLNIKFSCQGNTVEDRHSLIIQTINPSKKLLNKTFLQQEDAPTVMVQQEEDLDTVNGHPVVEESEQEQVAADDAVVNDGATQKDIEEGGMLVLPDPDEQVDQMQVVPVPEQQESQIVDLGENLVPDLGDDQIQDLGDDQIQDLGYDQIPDLDVPLESTMNAERSDITIDIEQKPDNQQQVVEYGEMDTIESHIECY